MFEVDGDLSEVLLRGRVFRESPAMGFWQLAKDGSLQMSFEIIHLFWPTASKEAAGEYESPPSLDVHERVAVEKLHS